LPARYFNSNKRNKTACLVIILGKYFYTQKAVLFAETRAESIFPTGTVF
jgi:hypothetical protein